MYNHAPENYHCPICLAVQGIESEETWIKQADIFYKDDLIMGFIGSKFIKGHEGHPMLVPLQHAENLYEIPLEAVSRIAQVSQRVAIALKAARACDGITVVQNNEPAGDQHAFHYHMHLWPRFTNDTFHEARKSVRVSDPSERVAYAEALKNQLAMNHK